MNIRNNQIPNKLNPMGIGNELPVGYTRVKALRCEVQGSAVINSSGSYIEGFRSFDTSYRMDITFRFYKTVNYQTNGCYMSGRTVQFGMNNAQSEFIFGVRPPVGISYPKLASDLLKHTMSIDILNGVFMLDSNIMVTFTPEPHVWDFGFTLGARADLRSGTTYYPNTYCAEEIYECSAYKNGVLCSKLIPCLDRNNRPCMYDTIRKITLYNLGTNEFSVITI